MKLSVHLFLTDILPQKKKFINKVVKSKIFKSSSNEHIFSEFKKVGISGIELLLPGFLNDEEIAAVKKVTKENNIKIYSIHQAIRMITKTRLSEIRMLFENAKSLGAGVIVLHMNSAGKQILTENYIQAIHAMQIEYGIKAGFENREKYLGSAHRSYGWDEKKFGELMKKEDLYVTLDTSHLGQAGGDITNFFNNHSDRIINIHLSDYKYFYLNSSMRPLKGKHLPLGHGTLPIVDFLKTLQNRKYEGFVTLEIDTDLNGIIDSAIYINNCT